MKVTVRTDREAAREFNRLVCVPDQPVDDQRALKRLCFEEIRRELARLAGRWPGFETIPEWGPMVRTAEVLTGIRMYWSVESTSGWLSHSMNITILSFETIDDVN